jgi:tetratricopeptide (TPR) repeat protein
VIGRRLFPFALVALLAALAWRLTSGVEQLHASRLLRTVESTSPAAARAGAAGQPLLRQNLALAQEATHLDPGSLSSQQALGSVYLLLGRPEDAASAYERALSLQPAAEIFMNLGHARHALGENDAAREAYRRAVALDQRLRAQVPAGLL